MKKLSRLLLTLLLPAALALPAPAQDEQPPAGSSAPSEAPKKKAPAKKKAAKKKKAAPVSEYKFDAVEAMPAYKFDKDSAPITKDKKKAAPKAAKKTAKKGPKKAAKKPVSEYKFDAVEKVPTYKMDKNADPIIKPAKKAKKAAPKKPAPAETGFGEEASGAIPETD